MKARMPSHLLCMCSEREQEREDGCVKEDEDSFCTFIVILVIFMTNY